MQKLVVVQYENMLPSRLVNLGLIRTKTESCVRHIAKVLEIK